MSDAPMSPMPPYAPEPDTQAGFCQDCGRPLTAETRRAVGGTVYCEPCLTQRLYAGAAPPQPAGEAAFDATTTTASTAPESGPAAGWNTVGAPPYPSGAPYTSGTPYTAAAPGYTAQGAVPGAPVPVWYHQLPKPVLAALLGLIPGVGAMYNGQFAKGIAHIIIFTILNSLTHISDSFGILVAGWIFYQSFEAYHTANARRMGLPLPDPFGLNNIGERLGMRGTPISTAWDRPNGVPTTAAAGMPPQPEPIITPPPASYGSQQPLDPYVAADTAPVAVTAYTAAYPVANAVFDPVTAPAVGYPLPGYTAVADPAAPPYPSAVPAPPASRFPVSAVWLLGLGTLFLVMTLNHNSFDFLDVVPWLLAAIAVWNLIHAVWLSPLAVAKSAYMSLGARMLQMAVGPGILLTVAVLLWYQFHTAFGFDRSWPVLLIAIGGLLLVSRLAPMPHETAPVVTTEEGPHA